MNSKYFSHQVILGQFWSPHTQWNSGRELDPTPPRQRIGLEHTQLLTLEQEQWVISTSSFARPAWPRLKRPPEIGPLAHPCVPLNHQDTRGLQATLGIQVLN